MNDRRNNDVEGNPRGFGAAADSFSNAVAHAAVGMFGLSNQIAEQTLDPQIDRRRSARAPGVPVFDRLTHRADALKDHGVAAIVDGSQRLRGQAVCALGSIPDYVRKRTVGSLLSSVLPGRAVELLMCIGRVAKPRT